jgi:hypothetical protein
MFHISLQHSTQLENLSGLTGSTPFTSIFSLYQISYYQIDKLTYQVIRLSGYQAIKLSGYQGESRDP